MRCAYGRGASPVVDIDSFGVEDGVCGLVGVNGAGKSTLLRTLAGCRRPVGGRVTVDGVDLYGRRRRTVLDRIGYMPQQAGPARRACGWPMPWPTRVWVRDVPARVAGARNPAILERVGLATRGRDRVRHLSGGMQRRLALAVALVTEPDVLLLDEPTTGLDPEQRAGLRGILAALGSSAVTVLSSHVMEDVVMMAEQAGRARGGPAAPRRPDRGLRRRPRRPGALRGAGVPRDDRAGPFVSRWRTWLGGERVLALRCSRCSAPPRRTRWAARSGSARGSRRSTGVRAAWPWSGRWRRAAPAWPTPGCAPRRCTRCSCRAGGTHCAGCSPSSPSGPWAAPRCCC
ncbi:ATP-binding cassette domain-containing protein [Nocardioides sp. W3-2-3]|nr:ATP-binding cassette domain-containing protein [Nocardioides convexus]